MWKCLEKYMSRVTLFPHQLLNFEIFFECQKISGNRWFSNLFSGNKKWNLGGKRVTLKFSSKILIIVVGLQCHEKKKSPKSY